MKKREAAKVATIEKVKLAAAELFGSVGYEAATVRDIANKAGVSTGSVFANWSGKAELYRDVYGHLPISAEAGRELYLASRRSGAMAEIALERRRQIEVEGWSFEHDDRHDDRSLAVAAACYAIAAGEPADDGVLHWLRKLWPWAEAWWKPADHPRRNLVKAGALIVAELERLERQDAAHG